MEEKRAVAYYEEVTRKGEGAARFKQGLGFGSSHSPSSLSYSGSSISSASFYNSFVKSSSASEPAKYVNKSYLDTINKKLKKREDNDESNGHTAQRVSRNRELLRSNYPRRRSRSIENKNNNRSKKSQDMDERAEQSKVKTRRDNPDKQKEKRKIDHCKAIKGYENMTPAEKVKARMKLQLSDAAGKDKSKGCGWERFEFDKDAPLDDEEIEVAEDDGALVKRMGHSFRFSSFEDKREEQIKNAHDEAIFGVPLGHRSTSESDDVEKVKEGAPNESLLSETVHFSTY